MEDHVIFFKRKMYDTMLKWKSERNGDTALLIQGARRIFKRFKGSQRFVQGHIRFKLSFSQAAIHISGAIIRKRIGRTASGLFG